MVTAEEAKGWLTPAIAITIWGAGTAVGSFLLQGYVAKRIENREAIPRGEIIASILLFTIGSALSLLVIKRGIEAQQQAQKQVGGYTR